MMKTENGEKDEREKREILAIGMKGSPNTNVIFFSLSLFLFFSFLHSVALCCV